MTQARFEAHLLFGRLSEPQLTALAGLLGTIAGLGETTLRDAPLDDEPETERLAVAEGRASSERNGGKGIPHAEAVRRLGLE